MNFRFKNAAKHFNQDTEFRTVTTIVTAIRELMMQEVPYVALGETNPKLEKPQTT